jgi:TonB family protein
VMRPAIVLTVDAPDQDGEDLNRALVHELEHVARRDWAIHCAARVACAVYWFHPLVWIAWRRLQLEAERACDDAVVARSDAAAYADQLVAVARRLSAAAKGPLLAMANRADLASRVSSVLDGEQRRGRAGGLCVTVAAVLVAVVVATMSPLRMTAAPQENSALPRFRTETMMVVTQVKVSYPNGREVEGLGAGDFVVTEDGVAQTISLFEFHRGDGGDVSSYYIVGYYPRNSRADGEFRKMGIVVKTATTARVEFREGYYAMRPPTVPAGGVVVRAGAAPPADSAPPRLLFKKEPEYSEEARKAKYQGTVLLNVEVDEAGSVVGVRVVRSLGLGLDEKAIEAVRQWRFKAAMKAGKAVRAETQVEVGFRLL